MSHPDSRRRRGRLRRTGVALALCLALAPGTVAAAVSDSSPTGHAVEDARVEKLQRLLGELEIYRGPFDGRPSAALSAALLHFQQSTPVPLGSELTDALFEELETAVRMRRLTKFLATLGREQSRQAREALLSQPATRDLVAPPAAGAAPDAKAPPPAAVFAPGR